jgi:hypothetical protein
MRCYPQKPPIRFVDPGACARAPNLALQRVRDKVLRQRESRRAGLVRRVGRRAERARPWLQFIADLTALLARLVK